MPTGPRLPTGPKAPPLTTPPLNEVAITNLISRLRQGTLTTEDIPLMERFITQQLLPGLPAKALQKIGSIPAPFAPGATSGDLNSRFAAYLRHAMKAAGASDESLSRLGIPEGKPYWTAVKTGGNPIIPSAARGTATPTTPVEAAAAEAATAAGRPRTLFQGVNLTPAEQNEALTRQLAQEAVARQFANEASRTPQFFPPSGPPIRTTIPRPAPEIPITYPSPPVGVGTPLSFGGQTIQAGDLASQLVAQATGQVERAAPQFATTTAATPPLSTNQVAANYLDEVLGTAPRNVATAEELAVTPAAIERASQSLAAQAARAGGAIGGIDEAAATLAPRSLLSSGLGLKGGLAAGIGLPIAGQLAGGFLEGATRNPQGEASDVGRVGGAALRGAGLGAGLGATIGAPLLGIGAIPGGLIGAGLGAVGGGLLEGLTGHGQSQNFETALRDAQTRITSAIPADLDPSVRNQLLTALNVQFQLATTPQQLQQIVASAPQAIQSAMSDSYSRRQQQARQLSVQSTLAPLLAHLYDVSSQESKLAYNRGLSAAQGLESISPTLAALSRERAQRDYTSALNEQAASAASLASYPASQSLDLYNNLNDQIQASLAGRLAQQVAQSYLPTRTASTSLTSTGLNG